MNNFRNSYEQRDHTSHNKSIIQQIYNLILRKKVINLYLHKIKGEIFTRGLKEPMKELVANRMKDHRLHNNHCSVASSGYLGE